MTKRLVRTAHSITALALVLAPMTASANSANTLSDLVGARASSGESDLESRGWVMIDGHKGGNASYTYWWNGSRKDCVRVTTQDGRYASIIDTTAGDCNQKVSNGGKDAAIGAAAAGAVLAAILLAHKSGHHDDGKHYTDSQKEAEYERGYRDGLHNGSYRNNNGNDSYSSGYRNGKDQRQRQLADGRNQYGNNGGYNNNNYNNRGYNNGGYGNGGGRVDVSDLVGAKAAGVDTDLRSRGFRSVDGFESGNNGKGTIWWNGRTRQCLQMITVDGRADSITDIQTHPRCR